MKPTKSALSVINGYTHTNYKDMNFSKNYTDKMIKAFEQVCSPVQENITTFRGINKYNPALSPTYLSTSAQKSIAKEFATKEGGSGSILRFHIQKGTKIVNIDGSKNSKGYALGYDREAEIILSPKFHKFKTIKKNKNIYDIVVSNR
jgi:hypothetical protein